MVPGLRGIGKRIVGVVFSLGFSVALSLFGGSLAGRVGCSADGGIIKNWKRHKMGKAPGST